MHRDRFPRTLREAFPAERYPALEVFTPRSSPERRVTGPALVLSVFALVALVYFQVIQ